MNTCPLCVPSNGLDISPPADTTTQLAQASST